MKRTLRLIILLALVAYGTVNHSPAYCCGILEPNAVFVNKSSPDDPASFLAGKLGILLPSYSSRHLVVAYRYLTGSALNGAEQAALTPPPPKRDEANKNVEDAIKFWLKERSTVPGAPPGNNIAIYRQIEGQYTSYLNCWSDSFLTAQKTLRERIALYGKESPHVRDWLAAQDRVYANCSEKGDMPSRASFFAPRLVRSDRAYQIAAAHFYAGDFDTAHRMFRKIADDKKSPWKGIAPYLAARCMIRKGTLLPEEKMIDRRSLEIAEKELLAILGNRELAGYHHDAERMIGFVRFRLYPSKRLVELAENLAAKKREQTISQDMEDFGLLFLRTVESGSREEKTKLAGNELIDWLFTFTSRQKNTGGHAMAQWNKKKTLPWLIAALAQASPGDKGVPALLAAADKVDRKSAGYLTISYYRIRLLMETGKKDKALRSLNRLISGKRRQVSCSPDNLLLEQRLRISTDLNDFLRHASRMPNKILYGDMEEKIKDRQPLFDLDSAGPLNWGMSLDSLKRAAQSRILPPALRREVAVAATMRGMLLDRVAVVRELLPVIKKFAPELTRDINRFITAGNREERAFATSYLMLRFPGALPYVIGGVRKHKDLRYIDSYSNKWWCDFGDITCKKKVGSEGDECGDNYPRYWQPFAAGKFPPFAGIKEKKAAREEIARIAGLEFPLAWLTKQATARARSNPDDPRVPEALSLAVREGQYACGYRIPEVSKVSKQAFQLLHKKYPDSVWAKKAKYWY